MTLNREQIEQGRAALARLAPAERQKLVESLAVLHRRKVKRAEREAGGARNDRHGA